MARIVRLLFLIAFVSVLSCERDDICTSNTPTTPRLLVEFRDILNQDELKSVRRLTAFGEGLDESTRSLVFNSNANALELPLIVGTEGEETTTRFILRRDADFDLDDDPNTASNEDILEITYVPEFVYVSRACGFKSVFNNLTVSIISDGDVWALLTDFPNSNTNNINVEDESETHLYIFH